MIQRIARWCYAHRRLVLALWVVALLGVGFAGSRFGGETADNFELPDSEAQQAFDLLESKFGGFNDFGARIVMESKIGFYDGAVRTRVGKLLADVRKTP